MLTAGVVNRPNSLIGEVQVCKLAEKLFCFSVICLCDGYLIFEPAEVDALALRVLKTGRIDTLITDKPLSDKDRKTLSTNGVDVIIANGKN
jgi:hypothetical protein